MDPFFPYHEFAQDLLDTIGTETGRPAYFTMVTEGLPSELAREATAATEPYSVVHLFGPTGPKDYTWSGRQVTISFYIQIDGIGRNYHDATWMLNRSVQAVREMDEPSYVNCMIVNARSSPFEINSEALRAIAQRLSVRVTRAA